MKKKSFLFLTVFILCFSCEKKDSLVHNTTVFGHVSFSNGSSASDVLLKIYKKKDGGSPRVLFEDNTDSDGNYKITFFGLPSHQYYIVAFNGSMTGGGDCKFYSGSYREINIQIQ